MRSTLTKEQEQWFIDNWLSDKCNSEPEPNIGSSTSRTEIDKSWCRIFWACMCADPSTLHDDCLDTRWGNLFSVYGFHLEKYILFRLQEVAKENPDMKLSDIDLEVVFDEMMFNDQEST